MVAGSGLLQNRLIGVNFVLLVFPALLLAVRSFNICNPACASVERFENMLSRRCCHTNWVLFVDFVSGQKDVLPIYKRISFIDVGTLSKKLNAE